MVYQTIFNEWVEVARFAGVPYPTFRDDYEGRDKAELIAAYRYSKACELLAKYEEAQAAKPKANASGKV